jgi:hypothetical protein
VGVKVGLKLREEGRLRVFENWVLRKILRPKWDKETDEWRHLHNEEPNGLLRWHYSPMRTFASLMALSQSALFFDLSFQLLILHFLKLLFYY